MLEHWADSFLPLDPFSTTFYGFIFLALADLALRKRFTALTFLIGPIAVHFLLSGLKLYPCTGRFMLSAVPLITLIVSLGSLRLCGWIQARLPRAPDIVLLLPLLAMVQPLMAGFPLEKEEIKESLRFMESRTGGEAVYVHYSSLSAAEYYRKIRFPGADFPLIAGEEHRDSLAAYDRQLDSLSGTVWLVFSHVYPFGQRENEESYMVGRLTAGGGRILDRHAATGSSVYRIGKQRLPALDRGRGSIAGSSASITFAVP